MTTIEETVKQIVDFIGHDYWTVACGCKKCIGVEWVKMPVREFVEIVHREGVDISNSRAVGRVHHNILQATV